MESSLNKEPCDNCILQGEDGKSQSMRGPSSLEIEGILARFCGVVEDGFREHFFGKSFLT